jgi:hypothetical protein
MITEPKLQQRHARQPVLRETCPPPTWPSTPAVRPRVHWRLGRVSRSPSLFVFADLAVPVTATTRSTSSRSPRSWHCGRAQPDRTSSACAGDTGRGPWAVPPGLGAAALLTAIVLGDPATARPHGWAFAVAILWRGVVYGAIDGLLLSSFPILATFAAFAETPLRRRTKRAVCESARSRSQSLSRSPSPPQLPDFRGSMLRKPVAGDVIWGRQCWSRSTRWSADRAHRPARQRGESQL